MQNLFTIMLLIAAIVAGDLIANNGAITDEVLRQLGRLL